MQKAVSESRITSQNERVIRKTVGLIGLFGVGITLALFPQMRESYALLSVIVAASVGTWRTGQQSLCGCVVNLKWNIDGKGFKTYCELCHNNSSIKVIGWVP